MVQFVLSAGGSKKASEKRRKGLEEEGKGLRRKQRRKGRDEEGTESKRGREGTRKGRKAKEEGGKKGGTQDELNQRGPK